MFLVRRHNDGIILLRENGMKRRKVLIVDDEINHCKFVKMYLELTPNGNYIVDIATDGKVGIQMAKKIRPDLILLDLVMPVMDGFQVLEYLKKDPATMSIPVVVLSGQTDDESKFRALQLYNDEYITKPVDLNTLKNKINGILDKRGA